ncbi:MAG: tRNA (guanosine(37)-N1)-methyltransferase TrmD [Actinobacteria bacterium]|nr:tRNA (guanosine(37)-N1)-methyltransferase TrmD [Actinomycetota bacterium]
MIIDVITIFPKMFENITGFGVTKNAFKEEKCILNVYDLRDFSKDKHRKVDDRPYGGGPGMVLMPQPLYDALRFIKRKNRKAGIDKQKTILLTPQGEKLKQPILKELVTYNNLILICGRYEGVDQRIIDMQVEMELSIGDYILTGGELPAMVLIEGITRLLPGVVGREESLESESFEKSVLDFPQFTRPPVFRGHPVPRVLLSGNHEEISKWRNEKSLNITRKRRPDLFDKHI